MQLQLSIFLSIYRWYIYGYLCLSVYLTIHLSTYLSIYLPIYPSTYLPIYLSIYLSIYLYLYISLSLSLSISISISRSRSIYLYLSIYPSANLKAKLFCETSSMFDLDNVKNEAVLRDFIQKWKVECGAEGLVPMSFAFFPSHLCKVLLLPRKSDARSYKVCTCHAKSS